MTHRELVAVVMALALISSGCDCSGSGGFRLCRTVSELDFEAPTAQPWPSALPASDAAFAVIGDTQRTSLQECVIGREVADEEAEILLAALAEARPAFVVHVGDLVFDGASEKHWQHFDARALALRERGTPMLAVPGNHEYWGNDESARDHLVQRFPRLAERTWDHATYGRLGLILLDSNAGDLGAGAWLEQERFVRERLEAFESDPDVRGVLVFAHHPPYTNSTVVDPSEDVRADLVPYVCSSAKAIAMLSGHAHGFEHFVRGPNDACGTTDTHFVVTGGGGGPRPRTLHDAADTGLRDLYDGPAPRPFHYLAIEQDDTGITVAMHGLDTGDDAVAERHRIRIPFPSGERR